MAGNTGNTIQIFEGQGRTLRQEATKTITLTYHGTYDSLEGEIKEKGKQWERSGLTGTWYVVDSSLARDDDGTMGTLTVICTDSIVGAGGDSLTPKFEQFEVDFTEVNQPIETHPDFPGVNNGSATDEFKKWLKFKASPLRLRLKEKYLDDPDDPDSTIKDLPSALDDWAELYNRGIETYMTYLPVVTRISEWDARPADMGQHNGKKESPPNSITPPTGYGKWLKTCDKATYTSATGRWTRTEQWTCAAEWPDLLYDS